MAIKKSKIIKGITADYWKIVDCNIKTGFVGLALYVNKESAQVRENMLDGRIGFQINFPVDVENPLAYAYAKIKESKPVNKIITEAIEEQRDPVTNEVIVEGVEAETVVEESNWFFDAEDC